MASILLRLVAFFLLWLAFALGGEPWAALFRTIAAEGSSAGEIAWAGLRLFGATGLLVLMVGAAFGMHALRVAYALVELTLGLRGPGGLTTGAGEDATREAVYDAIAAALLVWWSIAELSATFFDARAAGGLKLAFGIYFAVAAAIHFARRKVEAPGQPSAWEQATVDRLAWSVAGFIAFGVAGLAAAKGVHDALPEIVHRDDARPLPYYVRIKPCTVAPCTGRRTFRVIVPESGQVYLSIHDFEDCDGGPWKPDGTPFIAADGSAVHFELQRFGDSEQAAWVDGAPGTPLEFAVEACAFSLLAKEVE